MDTLIKIAIVAVVGIFSVYIWILTFNYNASENIMALIPFGISTLVAIFKKYDKNQSILDNYFVLIVIEVLISSTLFTFISSIYEGNMKLGMIFLALLIFFLLHNIPTALIITIKYLSNVTYINVAESKSLFHLEKQCKSYINFYHENVSHFIEPYMSIIITSTESTVNFQCFIFETYYFEWKDYIWVHDFLEIARKQSNNAPNTSDWVKSLDQKLIIDRFGYNNAISSYENKGLVLRSSINIEGKNLGKSYLQYLKELLNNDVNITIRTDNKYRSLVINFNS